MPVYTYVGNRRPDDGTASLLVSSGRIEIGDSGEITIAELQRLFSEYDLRPGVFAVDETNFPWEKNTVPDVGSMPVNYVQIPFPYNWKTSVASVTALPKNPAQFDAYLTKDTNSLFYWNGDGWELLVTFVALGGSTAPGGTGGAPSGGGTGGSVSTVVHASNPAAIFTHTSTDANGVESWFTSASNDVGQHYARVIQPTNPAAGVSHNIMIILPVEPDWGTQYGDAINYMRGLDIQNQYNLTICQIATGPPTWYADGSDSSHMYESFVTMDVAPWLLSTFGTAGNEEIWLIGFSRSGLGCMDLLFKHPDVFARGAAWDFPGPDMANYTDQGADNFGSQTNYVSNYQLNSAFIDALKGPFQARNRIWIGGYKFFQQDLNDFDALLTSKGVVHTFGPMNNIAHVWDSGWVPAAVADLSSNSSVPFDDFNRSDGGLGSNWTSSSDGAASISSNEVVGGGADSGEIRTAELFTADQWSQIETVVNSISSTPSSAGTWIGPAVRMSVNGQTCYVGIYFWNSGSPVLNLYKRAAGAYVQLGSSYPCGVLPAGTQIRVNAVGTTISMFLNGAQVITATDAAIANGNPGFLIHGNASGDNWIGGNGPGSASGGGGSANSPVTFSPAYTDNFNRSDGPLGANWISGADGGLTIASNVVTADQAMIRSNYYSNAIFISDQYSQIVVAVDLPGASWMGPSVRVQNSGNDCYLGVYFNNAQISQHELDVFKRIGGTFTLLGSFPLSGPLPVGTVLTLSAVGNTITFYQDGISRVVISDSTISGGGAPGIIAYSFCGIDNWGGDSYVPPTQAPANTVAPTISGSTISGHTLTVNTGTWTNSPSLSIQWQSDASGIFIDIVGQTAKTYTLASTDVGHNIRCKVTGTNAVGAGPPAYSGSVGPITAPSGTIYTDNFNQANGALASNWAPFSSGALQVVSNQVGGSGGTSGNYRNSESYTDDQYSEVQVEVDPSVGDWIGPTVRTQNNGQTCYLAIYFAVSSTTIVCRLYKRVNGAYTQLGSDYASGSLATGTALRLAIIGSTLTLFQNGVVKLTATDASIPTGGVPGIIAFNTSSKVDNWQGANS